MGRVADCLGCRESYSGDFVAFQGDIPIFFICINIDLLILSFTFWLNFSSEAGKLVKPTNFAWASKIRRGGLSVSSPSGEWEDACGLRR